MEHEHRQASNTDECFYEFIDHKVVGVIIGREARILVFDDGYGLAFSRRSGAFWTVPLEEIKQAVRIQVEELQETEHKLKRMLDLAGALE